MTAYSNGYMLISMETKLLQLQVPADLREKLREIAETDRRSMTAEAIWILEREIDRRLSSTTNTQVNLPSDAAERERMMERIQ